MEQWVAKEQETKWNAKTKEAEENWIQLQVRMKEKQALRIELLICEDIK